MSKYNNNNNNNLLAYLTIEGRMLYQLLWMLVLKREYIYTEKGLRISHMWMSRQQEEITLRTGIRLRGHRV